MKYWTGVGSRQTPKEVMNFMTEVAKCLSRKGWILRSGGADGADSAFEAGAGDKFKSFIAWDGFNGLKSGKKYILVKDELILDKAFDIASEIHPAWDKCSAGAQALHTRNIFQVLGEDLKTPSKFLIYWAKENNGNVQGGTRTAVEVARKNSIPTFNLLFENDYDRVSKLLER